MKLSLGLAVAGLLLAAGSVVVAQESGVPVPPPDVSAQQQQDDEIRLQVNAAMEGGVSAFKSGHYADAVASFSIAARLAPKNLLTHFYLGSAYGVQVVPNVLTPENTEMAAAALAELDIVVKGRPDYVPALEQAASVYRNIQKYDEALGLERQAVARSPNDVEAAYTVGYLDWVEANKNAVGTLAEDAVHDDGMGNTTLSHRACEKLRSQNTTLVDEGIARLKHVIELKPDNADAMQYLELMYRRRADLECGERSGLNADLRLADQWERKAAEVRKTAAAKPQ